MGQATPGFHLLGTVPHPNILCAHPSTTASAALGSAPRRTRALDQLVWPGGPWSLDRGRTVRRIAKPRLSNSIIPWPQAGESEAV